jgi:hypothetical protein
MHTEILCTASSDKTLKMWGLTPGTMPIMDTYESMVGVENDLAPRFVCSGAICVGDWGVSQDNPVFVGEDIEPCLGPVIKSKYIPVKCLSLLRFP